MLRTGIYFHRVTFVPALDADELLEKYESGSHVQKRSPAAWYRKMIDRYRSRRDPEGSFSTTSMAASDGVLDLLVRVRRKVISAYEN